MEDDYTFEVLKELKTDAEIKSFNDKAKSENKDTFIIYFANWCGHCKSLHPDLVKLDKILAKNKDKLNGNFVRVESDNIKKLEVFNDPNGFPTIVILDKNGKVSKEFNEDRDLAGFLKFLSNNELIDKSVNQQSGGKKTRRRKHGKKHSKKHSKKHNKKSRKNKH